MGGLIHLKPCINFHILISYINHNYVKYMPIRCLFIISICLPHTSYTYHFHVSLCIFGVWVFTHYIDVYLCSYVLFEFGPCVGTLVATQSLVLCGTLSGFIWSVLILMHVYLFSPLGTLRIWGLLIQRSLHLMSSSTLGEPWWFFLQE